MSLGPIATWAQSQSQGIKYLIVAIIVAIAFLLINFVLRSPSSAEMESSGKNMSAPPLEHAKSPAPTSTSSDRRVPNAGKRAQQEETHPRMTVKSENQSGGVTAGEIKTLNVNGNPK
jgi:hypothetical protein